MVSDDYSESNVLVSVIVPAYNAEKYVGKTVASVLGQELTCIELIVVNDGSSDHTLSVVKKALNESKLPYRIISQENAGVSAARNRGIDVARGRYLFFLDSDDYIDNDCLGKMYGRAEDTGADVVFCGFDWVNTEGKCLRRYSDRFAFVNHVEPGPEVMMKMLTNRIWVWTGSGLYKKEMVMSNNLRFAAEHSRGEDQHFILRALFHAETVASVCESLACYVQRPGSITNTPWDFDAVMASVNLFCDLAQDLENNNADEIAVDYLRSYVIPNMISNSIARAALTGVPSKQLLELIDSRGVKSGLKNFSYPRDLLGMKGIGVALKVGLLQKCPRLFLMVSRLLLR